MAPALDSNTRNLTPPSSYPIPELNQTVGDAFPLKTYFMKPRPRLDQPDDKIFNYRLSRTRKVSQKAFGILDSKFKVFWQPIRTSPECITIIVSATVGLHDYLRITSRYAFPPVKLLDGDINNSRVRSGNSPHSGVGGGLQNVQAVRSPAYLSSEGRAPRQREMAQLH